MDDRRDVRVGDAVVRPLDHVARVQGRLLVTTSSDQPLKGLVPLLEAVAKVRTERDDVHLVVIGRPKDGSKIPVELNFKALTDFEPEQVVQQVEPLKKLLEARQKLSDLRNKMAGNDKFEDLLK